MAVSRTPGAPLGAGNTKVAEIMNSVLRKLTAHRAAVIGTSDCAAPVQQCRDETSAEGAQRRHQEL